MFPTLIILREEDIGEQILYLIEVDIPHTEYQIFSRSDTGPLVYHESFFSGEKANAEFDKLMEKRS